MWQLKVCVGAHCVYRRCAIFQVINQDILLLFESSLVSTDCDGEVEPKIIFVLCEEFFLPFSCIVPSPLQKIGSYTEGNSLAL